MKDFNQLTTKDIMKAEIFSIDSNSSLSDARKQLHKYNVHHLLVIDKNEIVGMITSNELLAFYSRQGLSEEPKFLEDVCVSELMETEIVTIQSDAQIKDAAKFFMKSEAHALPVIDANKKVVGMLTSEDLLSCLIN